MQASEEEVLSIAEAMRCLSNDLLEVIQIARLKDPRISPIVAAGALFAAARMIQRTSKVSAARMNELYEGTQHFATAPIRPAQPGEN